MPGCHSVSVGDTERLRGSSIREGSIGCSCQGQGTCLEQRISWGEWLAGKGLEDNVTCRDRCVCVCVCLAGSSPGGSGAERGWMKPILLPAAYSCQGLGGPEFPCMGLEHCIPSRHCSWALAVSAESANGMPFSRG